MLQFFTILGTILGFIISLGVGGISIYEFIKKRGGRHKIIFACVAAGIFVASVLLTVFIVLPGQSTTQVNNPPLQATSTATVGDHIYSVKNTSETLPDGVYFRHSLHPEPGQPTPTPIYGFGVFKNDLVQVSCWSLDDAVSGDRVWYYVNNVTRPTVAGRENKGWINAYYVNDGMTPNHPAPGIPQCSNPLPIGG